MTNLMPPTAEFIPDKDNLKGAHNPEPGSADSATKDPADTSGDNGDSLTAKQQEKSTKKNQAEESVLSNPVASPMWLSISEAAKLGGVTTKTIRRAIQSEKIKYKIYKNRYLIGLRSLIIYLNSNTKLKNKLNFYGIGQYIKGWRE